MISDKPLTKKHWAVLEYLDTHLPAGPTRIGRYSNPVWPETASQVCQKLKRLVQLGFVRRCDVPDVHYAITASGRSALREVER